jgi:hypothetical protein
MNPKARFPALQIRSELIKIAIISLYASFQRSPLQRTQELMKNKIPNGGQK